MEGVNHIDVVEVGGCRLVRHVYRVFKREVPNGEGLKLCISRFNAVLLLVIKLGKAGRHFSATGSRSGNDNKFSLGFDIIVFTKSLITDDKRNVRGVICYRIVSVYRNAEAFKPFFKIKCKWLSGKTGYNNAADIKSYTAKSVNKA